MNARVLPFAGLAVAIAALVVAEPAVAKPLQTFGGTLELPFDFSLVQRTDTASNSTLGFQASQRWVLEIASGPSQGRQASLVVTYALPARGDSDSRARAILSTAQGGATQDVHLGSYMFRLLARQRTDAAGTPLATQVLWGTLNNSLLQVELEQPQDPSQDAADAQALSGFALDMDAILRARTRFDEAARAAIEGQRMHTPAGEFSLPGLTPRLYGVSTSFGVDGKVTGARVAYAFAVTGTGGHRTLEFASACGNGGGAQAQVMHAHFEPDFHEVKLLSEGAPEPDRFGGLEATRRDIALGTVRTGSRPTAFGSHWVAAAGETWFTFDLLSSKDAGLARRERPQLADQTVTCDPRALLTLDGGLPAPAVAP